MTGKCLGANVFTLCFRLLVTTPEIVILIEGTRIRYRRNRRISDCLDYHLNAGHRDCTRLRSGLMGNDSAVIQVIAETDAFNGNQRNSRPGANPAVPIRKPAFHDTSQKAGLRKWAILDSNQ